MNRKKRKKPALGFTLIEIMAVVVIIGLIGGVVVGAVVSKVSDAKKKTAKTQIGALGQALKLFHLDCGFYPSALADLVTEPTSGRKCKGYSPQGYLDEGKAVPADPWDNSYNYQYPGVHTPQGYDLWSNGPDGEEGTSDDIKSWDTVE